MSYIDQIESLCPSCGWRGIRGADPCAFCEVALLRVEFQRHLDQSGGCVRCARILADTSAASSAWARRVQAGALREAADALAAVAPGERVLLGSDVASLLRARADAIEKKGLNHDPR